ncbi:MAG TPA: radical SAM/SPASM domain-containing protein [Geobacteraceae bacterium]|nr:radical SAM/SPASM domain-containing protein [Geobacteraceae bacterium]
MLHPAFRKHPSRLFIELTTRCNLSCPMCVKQSWDNGIKEGDMSMETFLSLAPAFPHAEAIILNGIGESLLHPELEEFIRIAKSSMPATGWIGFQSNGLLLDEERAVSLIRAGLDKICLSLDAICPDTFRKIREGGEVDDLDRAFVALEHARRKVPDSQLQVGVEFVVMRDNIHQLPDVLRWSASRGVSFAIVSHLLPYEAVYVSQAAYDSNTDQAVELFQRWKRKAESEGINISNYFYLGFCKYVRTPEEQRVVDFVGEMMAEARSKDIFLHVKNLLEMDEAKVQQVRDTFAAAQAVADETGLQLKLPSVSPTVDRRCDFIENGGVLVSWDGTVHPCYFLWHRFICYFAGRKKHVSSREFGNLNDRGIMDIWNDETFLAFRQEVLKHEYPICSNCNLIPCEYLYAEKFEQDCYTNTVPCGDCFWCMGLFNCLQ